jgi:hypothetical protein
VGERDNVRIGRDRGRQLGESHATVARHARLLACSHCHSPLRLEPRLSFT